MYEFAHLTPGQLVQLLLEEREAHAVTKLELARTKTKLFAAENKVSDPTDVTLPAFSLRCRNERIDGRCTAPSCGYTHQAQIDVFTPETIEALPDNENYVRLRRRQAASAA